MITWNRGGQAGDQTRKVSHQRTKPSRIGDPTGRNVEPYKVMGASMCTTKHDNDDYDNDDYDYDNNNNNNNTNNNNDNNNHINNKILDRDWFSASLFVT